MQELRPVPAARPARRAVAAAALAGLAAIAAAAPSAGATGAGAAAGSAPASAAGSGRAATVDAPTGTTGTTGTVGPEVPRGPVRVLQRLVPGPKLADSYVARVAATTYAKARPWGANRLKVSPRAKWGGGASVLMVLDSVEVIRDAHHPADQRLWIKVALPKRPNGSSGWIPADYLRISRISWRIHVSTGKRLVQVYRAGRLVRRFGAVVGAPGTPTPHGLFAINEKIRQPDPKEFVGPWALHLTAFSDVLDNYGGGPGRVAIHGRDGASLRDPIGTARSHGCVRVRNADVRWLAAHAPTGTPVRIEVGLGHHQTAI